MFSKICFEMLRFHELLFGVAIPPDRTEGTEIALSMIPTYVCCVLLTVTNEIAPEASLFSCERVCA